MEVDKRKSKVEWLAGCAYLHVCFDLPRVLADTPGSSCGITNDQSTREYFALEPIFRRTFGDVADKSSVTGFGWALMGGVGKRVNRDAIELTATWVLFLRTRAWVHSTILASASAVQRQQIEKAMLLAMTAAFSHATTLVKLGQLNPPHFAIAPIATGSGLAAISITDPWIIAAATGTVAMIVVIYLWRRDAQLAAAREKKMDAYFEEITKQLSHIEEAGRVRHNVIEEMKSAQNEQFQAARAELLKYQELSQQSLTLLARMTYEMSSATQRFVLPAESRNFRPLSSEAFEEVQFVNNLGLLLSLYVDEAVRNPEGIESYIESRRQSLMRE